MFTDSHCHLYKEYYENIQDIINLAIKSNVNKFINNGCDKKSNEEVLESLKYDGVYGALGIHPEAVDKYSEEDILFIENNLSNDKIVAIGEIGLDYHYTKENKDKQQILFRRELSLAEKYKMPVIIHSRDATLDTLNILKEFKVVGVIHSFSGSLETAKEYIKMGFLLGINGVITFKNSNLKDVIKEISLDNIVLETDSPYLTPEPYRGKQNNPQHIFDIAKFVANLKNVSIFELANITNNNISNLFKINVEN